MKWCKAAIGKDSPHTGPRRAGQAEVVDLMGRVATHTGKLVTWDEIMECKFQFIEDIDNMTFDAPAPIHDDPEGIYPAPQPGITEEC